MPGHEREPREGLIPNRAAIVAAIAVIGVAALVMLVGSLVPEGNGQAASRTAATAVQTGTSATSFAVGGTDEVMIPFPPYSWFDTSPERPIVIRLMSGEEFIQSPEGGLFRRNPDGTEGDAVSSVGDVIPGSRIFVRANDPEEPEFKVHVSITRKG